MALGGDFGRIFLGGRTTREVGGDLGGALGSLFGPTGSAVGRSIGLDLGKDIGEIGSRTSDVSAPPAGVDSPATLSTVSQTGMINPLGMAAPMRQPTQAGFGLAGPLSQIFSRGTQVLSRPSVGGALTGFGLGGALDFVMDAFGNQKKLVITRKLQRDVKKVFMLAGGDVGFISANSLMLFGKDFSEDQILRILFKTFKNQGPYVTKAAVRKTRSTIRKMETLIDLKDRLCPPRRAPARRRMPAKSTTITNVR